MDPSVPLSKRIAWRLQYWAALALIAVMRRLSIDAASGFCGWLMRQVGPRLRAHKVGRRNLTRTFPEMSAAEVEQTLMRMWDNLGRIIGEMPHAEELARVEAGRVEVSHPERLEALRDDGKPGLVFGGHFGNWELSGMVFEGRYGISVHPFYRAPNNPLMHDLFVKTRISADRQALPKGRDGAKRAIEMLKQGEHLGLLIDQKMNDGIEIPFFGRPAMTAPALASFALKFNIEPVPCRTRRVKGARFVIELGEPIALPQTGNRQQDIEELMITVTKALEEWIREAPEQWLWVHRRWKD